jgi:hypothetical protein
VTSQLCTTAESLRHAEWLCHGIDPGQSAAWSGQEHNPATHPAYMVLTSSDSGKTPRRVGQDLLSSIA